MESNKENDIEKNSLIDIRIQNPQRSLSLQKSCSQEMENINFSDFPSSFQHIKNILPTTVLTIARSCEVKEIAHAFFQLKLIANQRKDKKIEHLQFQSYLDNQEEWIQSEIQPSNPDFGYLALQSKFSFKEKISKQPQRSDKNINRKVFLITKENQMLKEQIKNLQLELQKMNQRKTKEITKKQGSLIGLMEELGEKNQQIQQLKSTVRTLGSKIKAKEKGVHYMLQEDSQSFRRTILRLQHANDRLHLDVTKGKRQIQSLNKQLKESLQKTVAMEQEISKLKEKNFDLETHKDQVQLIRKQAQFVGKRFNGKIQKVRKLQKRLSMVVKTKDYFNQQDCVTESQISCKKARSGTQSTVSMLKQTQTIFQQTTANKLQDVLNFLLHIADENHDLEFQDLFDEDEKEFLKNHKQLFNKHKAMHSINKQKIQDSSAFFGHQLQQLLNQDVVPKNKEKQKVRNLQKECEAMISKVFMLKERELHIRSVVLNLLKAIDLRSPKKQTQSIVSILCQLFEYSQSQRSLIFTPKHRKLFGIL